MSESMAGLESLLSRVRSRRGEPRGWSALEALRIVLPSANVDGATSIASEAPVVSDPVVTPHQHVASATEYSSAPPMPEQLGSIPAFAATNPNGPVVVRPHSLAPASAPIVRTTYAMELPSAPTFGDLLDETLSLGTRANAAGR